MPVPVLLLAVALASTACPSSPRRRPPKPSSNASSDRLPTLAPPAPVVVEGCVATAREVRGHRRTSASGPG